MSPKFYVTLEIEGAYNGDAVREILQDCGYEPHDGQGSDGRYLITAADTLVLPDHMTLIQYADDLAADIWEANQGPCLVRVLPVIIERTTELVRGPADYARYRAAHPVRDEDDAEDSQP